ncbi:uncharacterized protein mgarpb [Paramisgurnus dabryanus]|uniref:uncharacterized protein mgarpb n=1 Tax=Paramisgurnus dabryanus TaxID=90735 RepID=UPI0031F34CEE
MMFCRTTWARLAPLTRKTLSHLSKKAVPKRQMSFGLPVSGTNIAFMVLGGGSVTAALIYAYKTINSDSARYNDRIAQFEAKTKRAEVAVTAAEVVAETAAVELTAVDAAAEELISGVLAAAGSPAEHSAAAPVEVEVAVATPTVAEAGTPVAEEPTTPVAEDVAADAASPVAVTMGETSSVEEAA